MLGGVPARRAGTPLTTRGPQRLGRVRRGSKGRPGTHSFEAFLPALRASEVALRA